MTHDPFTCTRRQDAELRIHTDELRRQDAELVRHCTSFEDLFGIVTRLATDVYTLRERVAALEIVPRIEQLGMLGIAEEVNNIRDLSIRERVAALEAEQAGVSYAILEPVRDDADPDDDPDPMEDVCAMT